MAISKTQPERPAVIELVDAVNAIMESASIPADEVLRSLSATNRQVLLLGEEHDELSDTVDSILARLANIKFGATEEITVPANDSYASSFVYPEPFGASSKSFVMLGFADDLLQATLSVTLIDSTYSGFSYSITNTDADPATVTIGYLAIAVG